VTSTRRRLAPAVALLAVLSVSTPAAAAPSPAPTPPLTKAAADALGRSVGTALAGSGARTIAAAVEVDGYGGVYRRNSGAAVPPASTQKSFTGLSVLLALGPEARLRTEVAATAAPEAGVLTGDLWLVGGGDPYLSGAQLAALAAKVRAAGITTVAGDLLLDDSRYDARRNAAGWRPSFVPGESGPLSAMALDRNQWRRDRAFLTDPALPAAVRFRDLLAAAGVGVTGAVRRAPRPAEAVPVAVHESAPVSVLVSRVLKASDNFASELLLKELGRAVRADGSSAAGVVATRQVLGAVGVPVGAGTDGSGLSSLDRQTPSGQVALLRAGRRSPVAASFRRRCPSAASTARSRGACAARSAPGACRPRPARCRASAPSPATRPPPGAPVVTFAFQLSGAADGAKALRAIDRAVVLLAGNRS
jgi:D-alanyl-D-alanine carboxypeptidase/D-alanyl-D-alanine-endopeptidase (penicillin-binding protein 4)